MLALGLVSVPARPLVGDGGGSSWFEELQQSEEARAIRGSSGALTDREELVWECRRHAPRSLLEFVPMQGVPRTAGTCGETKTCRGHACASMCQSAESGAWQLAANLEQAAALAECARLCADCASCNVFSASARFRDCSWFSSCDRTAPLNHTSHFETVALADARASEERYRLHRQHSDEDRARADDSWVRLLQAHARKFKRGGDSEFVQVARGDMHTLHHVVGLVGARTTGETGFASGMSAMAIMTALGTGATHVAIDPFQGAYNYDGLRGARSLAADASRELRFAHINETASMAVAWLHTRRVCFDAFFVDDGHKFDDVIVELFHASKMLAVGGALMLHDNWMPSVRRVQSFIETNMAFLLRVPNPLNHTCCITIYTKAGHDRRAWNHYVPFRR